jgi:hypothetical protein
MTDCERWFFDTVRRNNRIPRCCRSWLATIEHDAEMVRGLLPLFHNDTVQP